LGLGRRLSLAVDLIRGTALVAAGRTLRIFDRPLAPRAVNFAVTYRCNHRCQTCAVYGDDQFTASYGRELTATEIVDAFSDPLLGKLDVLRITGGEPFKRRDLTDIVTGIHRVARPGAFYVTTNGSFPDRVGAFLRTVGHTDAKIHLQISIDGVGETHDRIRGFDGAFEKAVQTLEVVKELRRELPVYAGVNHTLSRLNHHSQRAVEELAHEHGFGYRPMLARRYCENTSIEIDPLEQEIPHRPYFDLDPEIVASIYDRFRELSLADGAWTYSKEVSTSFFWKIAEAYSYDAETNRVLHGNSHPNPTCMALFSHFRLMPDGDVIPCRAMPEVAGNLRDSSFTSIWRSRTATRIRRQVKSCRGCWTCDIGPSIYYSGAVIPWFVKNFTLGRTWRPASGSKR
jgi:MoaA/NifB/PqqE/SkfB family radical SAM enzyme